MRLLTVDRRDPGQAPEAELLLVDVEGSTVYLTLDDGVELTLELEELLQAIDGEQAPSEREAA